MSALASLLGILLIALSAVVLVAVPLRRAVTAAPAAKPRAPADISRPWLRTRGDLDDPDDPRLTICPVCGMDDEPGNLTRFHLGGWPCHELCKEWLGDWKPPRGTARIPHRDDPEVIARRYAEALRVVSDPEATRRAIEGMGVQIARSFSIPPAQTGDGPFGKRAAQPIVTGYSVSDVPGTYDLPDTAQHARQLPAPVLRELNGRICEAGPGSRAITLADLCEAASALPPEVTQYCLCGEQFTGPSGSIGAAIRLHRESGECRVAEKAHERWPSGETP